MQATATYFPSAGRRCCSSACKWLWDGPTLPCSQPLLFITFIVVTELRCHILRVSFSVDTALARVLHIVTLFSIISKGISLFDKNFDVQVQAPATPITTKLGRLLQRVKDFVFQNDHSRLETNSRFETLLNHPVGGDGNSSS